MMRTILLKMLPVLMSVFCNLHGVDKECVVSDNQKTYIDLNQIAVVPEGMFVQLGNGLMAIDALYHDSLGYFFSVPTTWICPKCGFENGLFRMSCENCGYRAGEKI